MKCRADATVGEFKDLVLRSFFEDESMRRITVVHLLLGDKRACSTRRPKLSDSGVDAGLLVIFSRRTVECSCHSGAPYQLSLSHRRVMLDIPSDCSEIDSQAFNRCHSIEMVTIPSSVLSIGDEAFSHCKYLSSVTMADSVLHLGVGAFDGCVSLRHLSLSKGLTEIGPITFSCCSLLTTLIIP